MGPRLSLKAIGVALAATIAATWLVSAQPVRQAQLLQEGLRLLETRGDPRGAVRVFEQAAQGPDRATAARARLYVGVAFEKLGHEEARQHYLRVIREFADQPDVVGEARKRLETLPPSVRVERAAPATATLRRLWVRDPADLLWIGSLSRDGRVVAYGDTRGGITLADVTSAQQVRTIAGPDPALGPALAVPAPDGSAVVFQWKAADGGIELRLVRGDAGPITLLRVPRGDVISGVEWPAPNLVLVQVQKANTATSIFVVTPADGKVRTVLERLALSSRATLSGDGRYLAYFAPAVGDAAASRRALHVLDTASGKSTRVMDGTASDRLATWTARADWLLFVSDRTGTTSLWGLPMSGATPSGPLRLLQHDLGRVDIVLGVTGSDAFYYFRQVGLVDVYTVELGPDGRPSGPARGAAQSFIGSNMGPSFAPDGRTLAYLAQMGFSAREALGLRNVEDGTERVLKTAMEFLRLPRWSPDGTRLLVKGNDSAGRFGFHLIDRDTGATSPILVVPRDQESSLGTARWSPDGRAILYTLHVDGRSVLRRRQVATEQEATVRTFDPSTISGWFDVSLVDEALALIVSRKDGSSLVVRAADGTERELLRTSGSDRVLDVVWHPNGREIFFVRPGVAGAGPGGRSNGVWRIGAAGGEPQPVGVEMPGLRGLAVRPDGRQLAFTSGAPLREPWVVEHFLPAPAKAARRSR